MASKEDYFNIRKNNNMGMSAYDPLNLSLSNMAPLKQSSFAPQTLTTEQLLANPNAYANMDFTQFDHGYFGSGGDVPVGQNFSGLTDQQWRTLSPYDQSLNQEMGVKDAYAKNLMAGPNWMQKGQFAMQGLGSLANVMSYFDNRKLRKEQMRGLAQQRKASEYALQSNKDFKTGLKSSFKTA